MSGTSRGSLQFLLLITLAGNTTTMTMLNVKIFIHRYHLMPDSDSHLLRIQMNRNKAVYVRGNSEMNDANTRAIVEFTSDRLLVSASR